MARPRYLPLVGSGGIACVPAATAAGERVTNGGRRYLPWAGSGGIVRVPAATGTMERITNGGFALPGMGS